MSSRVLIIDGKEPNAGVGGVSAADFSHFSNRFLTAGVLSATDYLVEAQATPDMTVKYAAGGAYVEDTTGTFNIPVEDDTGGNVTIESNVSGNDRIDTIVIAIDTTATPNEDADNIISVQAVEGTPAASPTALTDSEIQTALGAGYAWLKLAEVTVENGATSITNADVSDMREQISFSLSPSGGSSANGMYGQALINGNFDVWQRATSFTAGANNDDVYTADRWNLISEGNDIVDVSQEAIADLPGSNYAIKLDTETSARFGIVQFLEAKDAQKFKGKYVSLSFAVKSANISALRGAVLSWGGAADSLTSDVVSSWGATPTWAANWTAENTPSDLTVTSSWTTVKIEGIYIDSATVNNLAVAIWTPNAETIGDIVYISQVQLCEGSTALPFQAKSFGEELRACQRYYRKYSGGGTAYCDSVNRATIGFIFENEMRTTPSYTKLAETTIRTSNNQFSSSAGTTAATYISSRGAVIVQDGYSGLSGNAGAIVISTGSIAAFSADL